MRKTTQRIVKQFPFFEQKLQDCHNVLLFEQALQSLDSDVEKTFFKLAWFFENPEEESFDLGCLYKHLQDDWLEFALEVIAFYFKYDTYLIKESKSPLIIKDNYVSQSEFARILNEKGLDYTQNKIAVYRQRGKFPQEDAVIGGVPYWTRESVEKFSEEKMTEKNLKE